MNQTTIDFALQTKMWDPSGQGSQDGAVKLPSAAKKAV